MKRRWYHVLMLAVILAAWVAAMTVIAISVTPPPS
jgi:hypothetical protein